MAKPANATKNEGAKILESLIDGISIYREVFDDCYFDDLNRAAQEIDKIEDDMMKQLKEKENEIEDLQDEVDYLKRQLEELQ